MFQHAYTAGFTISPRVKLTIIEGYYTTEEEIEKAVREARHGKKPPILLEVYSKHYEIICRPRDLLKLAKALTKI